MLASRNEVSDEMPSFIDHHKTAVRSSNGGKRSRSAAPQQRRHRRGESIHGLAIHERMSAIELVIVLGTFLSIGCMSQEIVCVGTTGTFPATCCYIFTCGEASRSRSSAFLAFSLFFLKSSQLVAIRAIINIKAIIVEVPDLDSDQCDQL